MATQSNYKLPTLQELLEAGVHFGHQVRRGDPRMNEYIYGVRGGVHIINLEASEKKLKEAAEFLYQLGKSGKSLLFVGTKKQAKEMVRDGAKKLNSHYVDFKWRGGMLTNFEEVKRNIKKLQELQELKDKGELTKYTKKEQLLITRKLDKFSEGWAELPIWRVYQTLYLWSIVWLKKLRCWRRCVWVFRWSVLPILTQIHF